MKLVEFKTTNFVQVLHFENLPSGEPVKYWRNALYLEKQDGCHVVIYADGKRHKLSRSVAIRKAELN